MTRPSWCGPHPALDRADTLARLAPLDIAEVMGDAGRRFERRVFSGTDQWGARPDGSLWVARVYENRVDWRDPAGKWTRGEPLPDRVLEVTRYDRELFLRRFPPELRSTAEQLPFAAIKPPFEAGLTGAGGEVWLEKSRAPIDSSRRYHVVDRQGRLREEIRVPGHGAYHRRGAGRRAGGGAGARRSPAAPLRLARAGRRPMSIPFASVRPLPEEFPHEVGRIALHAGPARPPAARPRESQGGLTLEKKLPATFGQLSNVVELGDGRVAFADTKASSSWPPTSTPARSTRSARGWIR